MMFIALAVLAYRNIVIEVSFTSLSDLKVDSEAVLGQWSQASLASI